MTTQEPYYAQVQERFRPQNILLQCHLSVEYGTEPSLRDTLSWKLSLKDLQRKMTLENRFYMNCIIIVDLLIIFLVLDLYCPQ